MFGQFAHWVTVRSKPLIVAWFALTVFAAVWAPRLEGVLKTGGFEAPNSESVLADRTIQKRFTGQHRESLLLVIRHDRLTVEDPAFRQAVVQAAERIRRNPLVSETVDYYQSSDPVLVGRGNRSTLIYVGMDVSEARAQNVVPEITREMRRLEALNGFGWWVTGAPALSQALNVASKQDLLKAEKIGIPVMLAILLFVFRSGVAAVLPLVIGGSAIALTLGTSYWLARIMNLNLLLSNIVTMIGLGVAIDYALFMVSRFRHELKGHAPSVAAEKTVLTAGRAVLFSGLTVIASLASLFIPNTMVFRSLAIGGVMVVSTAVIASLTVLPAILALLGERVNRLRIPLGSPQDGQGIWRKWAPGIMRYPIPFALAAVALLTLLSTPILRLEMRVPTAAADVLPKDSPARVGFEVLREEFRQGEMTPVKVVLEGRPGEVLGPGALAMIAQITSALEADPDVARVRSVVRWNPQWTVAQHVETATHWNDLPAPARRAVLNFANLDRGADTAVIQVIPKYGPDSRQTYDLVKRIRGDVTRLAQPEGWHTSVGGQTARGLDFDRKIAVSLPWMIAAAFGVTFVVLCLTFSSLLIPVKAIIMNTLVALSSMGILVLFFQDGYLFDWAARAAINSVTPVVLFAVLFGLSMDYEVFILSEMKERYDRGMDNTAAVSEGLAHTAGLVNGAAAIMIAVFGAFAFVETEVVKELGFGLAAAILLDATVVRSVLIPSTMRLLGRWNWWMPQWRKMSQRCRLAAVPKRKEGWG